MNLLGIDVGGSGIKGAIADTLSGEMVTKRKRIRTPDPATPDAMSDVIAEIVRHFDYKGPVGMGFPAAVVDGVVRTAANIDESWLNVNVEELVARKSGCQTTVINDADAAGLAEMRFGAGRHSRGVVLVLTLGTGIDSGLFVDGKLVPNAELGHVFLKGSRHDAEHHAANSAREREDLSWKKWAARLDEYLHHLEYLFWPNKFILGGGVSKRHNKFIPHLTVETEVTPAVLRNEAGIIGAAMAAVERERP